MRPIGQLAVAAAITLFLPTSPRAQESGLSDTEVALPAQRIAPGKVIVRFEPGTSDQTRDRTLAAVDAVFFGSPVFEDDLVLASVPVGTEFSAAASLAIDTNVVDAEPVVIGQVIAEQSALH